jgi:anti-anti-sigma regulatory factor
MGRWCGRQLGSERYKGGKGGIGSAEMAAAHLPQDVQLERPSSGVAVVSFTGEHDLATRDAIRVLLATLVRENHLVVADFSTASFVDTSILVVVRESSRVARERGSVFRLQLATAPIVDRIFRASGVLDELDCVSTRQEGLRAVATSEDPSTDDLSGGRSSG